MIATATSTELTFLTGNNRYMDRTVRVFFDNLLGALIRGTAIEVKISGNSTAK